MTAPERDDEYLVNGQKIWTSGAMWAQWCLLLARTEPDQPRHRGLSTLAVDMTSPGIERWEITLANGSSEFAEVFFDDVRVPACQLVGSCSGTARSLASRDATDSGPAGSLDKLLTTRVEQRLCRVLGDLAGTSFVLDDEPFAAYLWARAQSVYGGT